MSQPSISVAWQTMRDAIVTVVENAGDENQPQPVPTGFIDLDKILDGGFPPGELILLGARPSVGKTALALNIATNIAKRGGAVVFYSLETNMSALAKRVLSSEIGVASAKISKGEFDDGQKASMLEIADNFGNFFTDERPGLTVRRLEAEITGSRIALDLIVIDYTQLIQASKEHDRYLEVGSISRGLKALCLETGIPILALAQLNRQPEGRTNKKPVLADLRESGSLEMDASIVLLLHKASDTIVNLEIAKNKEGPRGEISLVYEPTFTRFRSADMGSVAKLKASSGLEKIRGTSLMKQEDILDDSWFNDEDE